MGAITNYQYHLTGSVQQAITVSSGDVLYIRNVGPRTIFVADSGNGATFPADPVDSDFGYPLEAGETLQINGSSTNTYVAFGVGPDDEYEVSNPALVRAMHITN